MKIIIAKNYEEMSQKAAEIFEDAIQKNPKIVLGLATGSTPVGMYEHLAEAHAKRGLDFSGVQSFNLDEYVSLAPEHPQSYHYFMNENLFSKVNIQKENTHFPAYNEEKPEESGARYDEAIEEAGGIDLQVLGIGQNGHIAFNEPAEQLSVATGLVTLTQSTIAANSRFFDRVEDVPKQAISSGMGTILKARKIVILASGADKKDAVAKLLDGTKVTTQWPVTLTLLHPDVTLIVDEAAAGK